MPVNPDVREVVDDAAIILHERGVKIPNLGRMMRLVTEAESDFCRRTGLLVEDLAADIAAGTSTYTINPTSPHTLIRVKEVRVSGVSLKPIDLQVLDQRPSFYGDSYQSDFAFVSLGTIRLGWTPPALITGGLKWTYHFEPNTVITGLVTALALDRSYWRYLKYYIVWKVMEQVAPALGQLYEQEYREGVNICAVWPIPEHPKPIKVK